LVELKRLVESLKIINDLGGVEKLTPAFITTDKHVGYTHVRMVGNGRLSFLDDFCDFIPDGSISIKRVMTAIHDHESVYQLKCSHGYDVACLICGFGTVNGERVYHNKGKSK